MKPHAVSPARLRTQPSAASKNPETVALIAAILRQMDHAANLVAAFFRSLGLTSEDGKLIACLPPQFLLKLGALLELREWQDAGVVQWSHPDGLTVDDLISESIDQLQQGSRAFARTHRGTEAMVSLLRTWNEACSPVAREHLACDIAIELDSDGDFEQSWKRSRSSHGGTAIVLTERRWSDDRPNQKLGSRIPPSEYIGPRIIARDAAAVDDRRGPPVLHSA